MGKIAAALTCKTLREYPEAIEKALDAGADIIEFRGDFLSPDELCDLDGISDVHEHAKKPVITTLMAKYEGGNFPGNDIERLNLYYYLFEYSRYGITIEKQALQPKLKDGSDNLYVKEFEKLLKCAKNLGVQVIVGDHDFKKTPESMDEILDTIIIERNLGADIAKIGYMTKSFDDVYRILSVLEENLDIPIIAIPMGEYGKVGRLLSLLNGSEIMYGSVTEPVPNTGMMKISEMKELLSDENFKTKLQILYKNTESSPVKNLELAYNFMNTELERLRQ